MDETLLWLAIASMNGTSIAVSAYPTYGECIQYLELNRSGNQCIGIVSSTGGTVVFSTTKEFTLPIGSGK